MSQANSRSSSYAQDLLDALIDLRQIVEQRGLGTSDVFRDSGRFKALMRDLHPDMKKEISIIATLIDEGLLLRLHSVDTDERARVSGLVKVWLDNFGLKSDDAQTYSDVLLAFCNGETTVVTEALQTEQAASPILPSSSPSASSSPSLKTADDLFSQGALLYAKGKYREAADWFLKAAAQGSADAQFMLGNMHRDGQGVVKDWDQAFDWYIKAAAQGHAEAKQAMRQGPAAAPMPSQPAPSPKPVAPVPLQPWYFKPAAQGHAEAKQAMRQGTAVTPSPKPAMPVQFQPWYYKAIAKGHSEAKQAMRQGTAAASPSKPAAMPEPLQPIDPPKPTASSKLAVPSLRETYANKRVGEYFKFGRYHQGANGEIEPITWLVVQRNADHLLVLAEHGLDCKPYHTESISIDWAGCILRYWLNYEFYLNAFNEQERECVLTTSIVNNAGPKTEDNIFLLSVEEAQSFFANDRSRCAKPTEHAVKNGAYTHSDFCYWWLRSRGCSANVAAYVSADGFVNVQGYNVYYGNVAVRPALKLAL